MNWATLAPETRLYKGKSLYRWEVSPGLEHHCGICATPLHNRRARTSCIGKHVEPCYRFHQQLHFVGKSHECFGCNSSDEMHHNRHKEILKIVRQIVALDEPSAVFPPARPGSSRARRGSSTTNSNSNTFTDTGSECVSVEDSKVTRRERKKAKKSGNGTKYRKSIEAFPSDETNFISEAIHLTVHESKGAWEGTYIYDHKKAPVEDSAVVDEDDAEYVEESLVAHFESFAVKSPATPLKDLTPRQRNTAKKTSTPVKHGHGFGSRKFATQFTVGIIDPYDSIDPAIFFRLGIDIVNPPKNSKVRKDLVAKLVAAVKEDIDIINREDKETEMRAEGFWRWAGRAVYHTILQTRENLDWATGQKKGLPRFDDLDYDDDMGPEAPDEADREVKEEKPLPQIEKAIPKLVLKIKAVDGDGFMVASNKKVSAKKPQGNSKKPTKLPISHQTSNPALVVDEEEDGEDVVEMLRRYEQRKSGERNIGGSYNGSTPDRRTGRGKALTLIVK